MFRVKITFIVPTFFEKCTSFPPSPSGVIDFIVPQFSRQRAI